MGVRFVASAWSGALSPYTTMAWVGADTVAMTIRIFKELHEVAHKENKSPVELEEVSMRTWAYLGRVASLGCGTAWGLYLNGLHTNKDCLLNTKFIEEIAKLF